MKETEKPYQLEKDMVYTTGKSLHVDGDKVPTGKVLRVTNISAVFSNIATTEYVILGYWNGHAYISLHKGKPAVAGDPVHWKGNIWLREGQWVATYLADVANGEKIQLRASGHWEN